MKLALAIVFLFSVFASKSQQPEYYVYLAKGEALHKKANGQVEPVKRNMLVYKTDAVILKNDASVTLVNKQLQNLILPTAGIYKVAELGRKLHVNTTGIAKQYLGLLWQELVSPAMGLTKSKNSDLAASWGGLSTRGALCNNRIFPISGLKSAVDTLLFKWQATSPSRTYQWQLLNVDGTELLNKAVNDTQLLVPIREVVGNKNGKYYWLVKSADGTCEDEVPIYFEVLSTDEENKQVQALLSSGSGDEVMDKLQLIEKLEKQAMIYAASEYFEKLVSEHPGNEALKKSYAGFLLKYGFEDKARRYWKE